MKPVWLATVALGVPLLLVVVLTARRHSPSQAKPVQAAPAPRVDRSAPPARPRLAISPTTQPTLEAVLSTLDDLLSNALEPSETPIGIAGNYLARRDYPRALSAFDRLLVRDADNPALLLGKGMALAGLGRYDDALPLFERAVERDPASTVARYNLAVTLTRLGQVDEAAATLRTLLATHPEHAAGQFNLATLMQARQRFGEAIVEWRKLTDAEAPPTAPADARAALLLRVHQVQAWSHRGECAMALNRFQEAEACFQKVVALEGDARALADLGIAQAAQSKNQAAIVSLEAALKLDPRLTPALNQLAYTYALRYRDTGEEAARAKVLEFCARSLALAPEQGNIRQLRSALEHETELEEGLSAPPADDLSAAEAARQATEASPGAP